MKIFSVEDMQRVLKMPAVVEAHRIMEVELAEGRAINRLRSDIYCPTQRLSRSWPKFRYRISYREE
jgi:hypothetical protein